MISRNSSSVESMVRSPGNDSPITPIVRVVTRRGRQTSERCPRLVAGRSGYRSAIAAAPVRTRRLPLRITSLAGVRVRMGKVSHCWASPSRPPARPTSRSRFSLSRSVRLARVAPTASAVWVVTILVTVSTVSAMASSAVTLASRVRLSPRRRAARSLSPGIPGSCRTQSRPTTAPSRHSGEQLTSALCRDPSSRATSRRPAHGFPARTRCTTADSASCSLASVKSRATRSVPTSARSDREALRAAPFA